MCKSIFYLFVLVYFEASVILGFLFYASQFLGSLLFLILFAYAFDSFKYRQICHIGKLKVFKCTSYLSLYSDDFASG